MLTVIALGGNALVRKGGGTDIDDQVANLAPAVKMLAAVGADRRVVVTHGNGPQIGLLALQAAKSPEARPAPLDVLGAESEGQIGYLIDRELAGRTNRLVATMLTQTIVDPEDPAFSHPSKPIGPVYSEDAAQKLAVERGWVMTSEDGGFGRVVASPKPVDIVEAQAVKILADRGVIVICCGGGGVPVVRRPDGALRGVEAVVDKDLASSFLAVQLGADELILLTDVEGVFEDWGTPGEALVPRTHPEELRTMDLPDGSMGPKAEACARFCERTGGRAAIGSIEEGEAVLAGSAGTQVLSARN